MTNESTEIQELISDSGSGVGGFLSAIDSPIIFIVIGLAIAGALVTLMGTIFRKISGKF